MNTYPRHSRGYSLIEMLLVVALLAMGINLCVSIFSNATRLSALSTQALDRINGIAEVERVFADAVRGSCGVVPGAGRFSTGDTCAVLRLPSEDGVLRYRAVGEIAAPGKFAVIEFEDRGGTIEETYLRTLWLPVEDVRMAQGGKDADSKRAVTLDFAIKLDRGERAARKTIHSVTAAARAIAKEGAAQ